jgi:co-chaperonin GroES (HSP10)
MPDDRKLTPLRGRVRIMPDEAPRRIGSIIIPDQAKDDGRDRTKPRTGIVLAIGAPVVSKKGVELPYDFCVGDRVLYQFGQLSSDGVDAWCASHEILGVIEKTESDYVDSNGNNLHRETYLDYDRLDLEDCDVN